MLADGYIGKQYTCTYNADGIRTSKTVNGVKHTYALSGSTILNEEWTENGVQHLIVYVYDAAGSPVGMMYRNSGYAQNSFDSYLFGKNIQGDILYIYDMSGNRLVSYIYDAWGNILSTTYSNGGASTSARFNPFRYRGYYCDAETGLYYLNSRYYDPVVGRFLNADGFINGNGDILGYNFFAYCSNNPVMFDDPSGNFLGLAIGVGTAKLIYSLTAAALTIGIAYTAGELIDTIVDTVPSGSSAVLRPNVDGRPKPMVADIGAVTTAPIALPDDDAKADEKDIVIPPSPNSTVYYHVTTLESALAIILSGKMIGGSYEGGYVYAWKKYPSEYAIENSGAHFGVIISFQTLAPFVPDTGITDSKVYKYEPVCSAVPGPISVYNVLIVG